MPIGNYSCSWVPEDSKIIPSYQIPDNKLDLCGIEKSLIRTAAEFQSCYKKKNVSIDWNEQKY